jgi:hypothetical protein
MSKTLLALVAAVVILTAAFTPSIIVRAQGAQRFEYVRVTPYIATIPVGSRVTQRVGYRACIARANEWTCQEFQPTDPTSEPLRNALVNLGNEGWELVSAVDEYSGFANQFGANQLTYVFKRQVR